MSDIRSIFTLPSPSPWLYLHGFIYICMHVLHRVEHSEVLSTPLQETDPGGTITMVTPSGRELIRQTKTNKEDTCVQETNPASTGQIVFVKFSMSLKK